MRFSLKKHGRIGASIIHRINIRMIHIEYITNRLGDKDPEETEDETLRSRHIRRINEII